MGNPTGRRDGTVSTRICLRASKEMVDLRRMQTDINTFLWTSEIHHYYALADLSAKFPDGTGQIEDACPGLPTNAFYRNNQGRSKYKATIARAHQDATKGRAFLYRAVLTYFASAFESYLEAKVRPLLEKKRKNQRWGPYLGSLDIPELRNSQYPPEVETLLAADICRQIRNRVVHPPFDLPHDLRDPLVNNIREKLMTALSQHHWPVANAKGTVNSVVGQFFGDIRSHAIQAPAQSVELFYALFNFTALDRLACELDEALLPEEASSEFWIWRREDYVRRKALRLDPPPDGSIRQVEGLAED